MDIIKMTRELGKAIQQDERYKAYAAAQTANDEDTELQKLISDFEQTRTAVNAEVSRSDRDQQKVDSLNEKLRELYAGIMRNENMAAFNKAQDELEQLISDVNQIITMCANGEDPDTCEIKPRNCSGSCSTCGGC